MSERLRVQAIERGGEMWFRLAEYAKNCTWRAGLRFAEKLYTGQIEEGDTVFVLLEDGWKIAGYCALCREDYIPDCPYTPWCSWVFVDEAYRGCGNVGLLLQAAKERAREKGFETLYVCSDHVGLYEKYGFLALESRLSRDGTPQTIFARGTRY